MGSAERPIEPAPRFAIVGYAARFPGAADADEFWDVLRDGRDAISEVPKDRWDVDEFFDPEPGAPGKIVTRRAGFVDDVTGFDAPFFGMSTREVRMMDPQHRLLLETAWRAVEHSGTAPTDLANTNTGVFVGLGHPRLPGHGIRRADLPRDRGLPGHRDVERRGGGPDQLPVGAAGSRGRRRHGVQLVAGGDPPGLPGAAAWANATSRWPAARTCCSPRRP